MEHAIGFDLGGSSVKAAVVTAAGDTLAQRNISFDPNMPMQWAETIRRLTSELQDVVAARSVTEPLKPRIGLSAPGLAARDRRSIACMPGRLQGLEGLDWKDYLGWSSPIPVLNDAHAALLGEAWLGAAQGFDDVFMLTLGTGVGGAALVAGKLLRGHTGRGGHFGHSSLDPNGPPDITGMPGSLEEAIGNCSIASRTGGRYPNTHALVEAHKAGDPKATEIWLNSVKALACAVGSFINIVDPEAVIIGGGIARSGPALFEPLQRFLDAVEWRPTSHKTKLLPAKMGEYAGAYGSAANALGMWE